MISLFFTFCLYTAPTQLKACSKSLEAISKINNIDAIEEKFKKNFTNSFSPTLQYIGASAYSLGVEKKIFLTINGLSVNLGDKGGSFLLEARF